MEVNPARPEQEPEESSPFAPHKLTQIPCTSASMASFSLWMCCVIACTAASCAPMACRVALAELARHSSRLADTAAEQSDTERKHDRLGDHGEQ